MATAHIESNLEDIADIVLMPGDPLRAKYIAEKFLDNAKIVNTVRNMTAYTGYYGDKRVTIFPSGMGIPSIGIYAYELFKFYNVKKIIRIGTCGTYHPSIKMREVILTQGAYAKTYFPQLLDSTETNYVEASVELNKDILYKAELNGLSLHIGKTITSDVFDPYCDDMEKFRMNFIGDECLAAEMEAFGLLYLAKKLGKQASCLMTVVDSKYDKTKLSSEEREQTLDKMIVIALETLN